MGYTGKTLEELDLMDDFLINAVTTNTEVAEPFCRTVLSVLLQRKISKLKIVAQRTIPAFEPDKRGIRMDVEIEEYADDEKGMDTQGLARPSSIYDLEPHLRDDIHLPKHNRFYQAKIDSRYLLSGERDFSRMPDLYVITITSYDPFGYDYMMYTMENRCKEIPELVYDDGLQFLYFYTGGTKGGNEAIKTMLEYFGDSSLPMAKDCATQELHEYIRKVKLSEEARIDYMKYDDLMYFAKKDGRAEGRTEGRVAGKAESVLELLEELESVPENMRETILAQTDLEILKKWLRCAARAESLEEWKTMVGWDEE